MVWVVHSYYVEEVREVRTINVLAALGGREEGAPLLLPAIDDLDGSLADDEAGVPASDDPEEDPV